MVMDGKPMLWDRRNDGGSARRARALVVCAEGCADPVRAGGAAVTADPRYGPRPTILYSVGVTPLKLPVGHVHVRVSAVAFSVSNAGWLRCLLTVEGSGKQWHDVGAEHPSWFAELVEDAYSRFPEAKRLPTAEHPRPAWLLHLESTGYRRRGATVPGMTEINPENVPAPEPDTTEVPVELPAKTTETTTVDAAPELAGDAAPDPVTERLDVSE